MKTKEKKESSFLNRLFTGVSLVYLLLGVLLDRDTGSADGICMLWDQCCAGHNRYHSIVKYFLEESYKNLNQYGFSIGVFFSHYRSLHTG